MESIQERFIQFIKQKHLLLHSEKALLAVSGGIDSMLLLHLFLQSPFVFEVAHCNFKLRGADSDADEEMLVEYCKGAGIKLHVKQFSTQAYANKEGLSIQLAARKLRYEWFAELCIKNELQKIATAHHLNDSIETFFINLNRGTGINGLKGIPIRNKNIIRPLSIFSRKEIAAFVQKNEIPFREDRSNKDSKYLRNWFRNKLFPIWEERNPEFEKLMRSNIHLLSRQANLLTKFLKDHLEPLEYQLRSGSIEIKQILQLPDPEIILYEVFHKYGFSFTDMQQLMGLLQTISPGKKIQTNVYEILIDREKIFFKKIEQPDEREYIIRNSEDVAELPINLTISTKAYTGEKHIDPSPRVFQADLQKVKFPLLLRKWKTGDSFRPMGMRGRKKISDYLIDQKIPLHQKKEIYVLLSDDTIIWLVGFRANESIKLDKKSKKILEIVFK